RTTPCSRTSTSPRTSPSASVGGGSRRPRSSDASRCYVTVPLILPSVLAGAILAFALSLDDLVVTSFNAGVGSTTLPIFIYCSIKFGGHAPDQRDLVDHRGGRLDRPVHRVAPRRVPHESRPARRRGRPGGLTLEKSVSPAGPASSRARRLPGVRPNGGAAVHRPAQQCPVLLDRAGVVARQD